MKNIFSGCFFSLTLLLNAVCISGVAQDSAILQYIQKYRGIAEEEMERTGVPAAISLAQGIVESQAGQGWLVEHSHNHFGIKCKADWTGDSIAYDDDRKNECFRVYETDDSSWRDHSDFLKNSPRYAFLFQLDPLDYKGWAYGLKKAGYATSKVYADKLIAYIEKYNLQQFSALALSGKQEEKTNSFAAMLNKKIREDEKKMGISEPEPAPPAKPSEPEPSPYPDGAFAINGRRVLYLPQGAQLMAVADKYHIRLSKLLRFNDLNSDVLSAPALVYLQKKGKKGAHDIHIVADHESMASIAAEEGIQLKWLYKWNRLAEGDPITKGEALYLQGYRPQGDNLSPRKPEREGFFARVAQLFSRKSDAPETAAAPEQLQPPRPTAPETAAAEPQQSSVAVPKTAVAPPEDQRPPETNAGEGNQMYRVQAGDTLYSISRKYKVSVSQIRQWNSLEGDSIRTGQQIIVKK